MEVKRDWRIEGYLTELMRWSSLQTFICIVSELNPISDKRNAVERLYAAQQEAAYQQAKAAFEARSRLGK